VDANVVQPDSPLVTIIIPVYNRVQLLNQAIDSALNQTHPHIQVIVVDDGSPIDPWPIVEPYGRRVEFLRKPNGGLASARNYGLTHARGVFAHFLDDDDFLEPDGIRHLLRAIGSGPGFVWAAGRFQYVDTSSQRLPKEPRCSCESGDLYPRLIERNVIGAPSSVLIRTDVVQRMGYFDESFRLCEDYDFWLCVARDQPIAATREVVTNYRLHQQQISKTQWSRHFDFHLKALHKHRLRARPGYEPLFDKALARIQYEYGDDFYVRGQHAQARACWRKALSIDRSLRGWKLTARFAKSFCPPAVLNVIRSPLRLWRSVSR